MQASRRTHGGSVRTAAPWAVFLLVAATACGTAEEPGQQSGPGATVTGSAAEDAPGTGERATGTDTEDDEAEKKPIPHHSFVSRPDLMPPQLQFTHGDADPSEQADGHLLITPVYGSETPSTGAMIFDADGEPIWVKPSDPDDPTDNLFDLRVQHYQGDPVLTVYEGTSTGGRGDGEVLILDQSYEEIARVTTGGDLGPGEADFHDTTITEEGTMLLGAYVPVQHDLSAVGGPQDGWVEDAVIQEVDIETGDVLFEWSALDHVPVTEAMLDFEEERAKVREEDDEELGTEQTPYDYFHINSITEDLDGALLVSARHTSAVYRLNRSTGDVEWTLGGSASDFEMGEGAEFAWQHDAQRDEDGSLTLLDNHLNKPDGDVSSRGLRLKLDEESMTASVATTYEAPDHRPSGSMANNQLLDNGGVLVGWGQQPYFSEFTREGELLYDVCHGDVCTGEEYEGGGGSYRAYKLPWEGQPAADPDVVVTNGTAHVSWNGATEVAQWRLLTGGSAEDAEPQTTVDRQGFETQIPVPEDAEHIAVQALDASGQVLGEATPAA